MRIASMGNNQFPSVDLAENVRFKSDTTLLDYDILLWNPVQFIYEYFPNTNNIRYQDEGIVLDETTFNKIMRDISRRDGEMNEMLDNGKSLFIYTPYPIYIYTTA